MEMKKTDTAPLLWLSLALMIGLAIAFLLPVTPNDYWWYLRLGGDTLAAGEVLQVDTFTYSQAGTQVAYHSWGSAILFFGLDKLGGLLLVVLVRGLLVTLAGIFLWMSSRRQGAGRFSAAVVLLLVVLSTSNNWSLRPQLFAYPLFALAVFILYQWLNGKKNSVYWLPLISLTWVNLHGSFVMLILLCAAALIFPFGDAERKQRGDRRTLAFAFVGIFLSTLVNPRGFGSWVYVFTSLTVPSSQLFSAEWLPPVNDHWQMNLFFGWLLVFPLLAVSSPRKPSLLEWTWFIGFGILALLGERYVIWFIYILSIQTTKLVSAWEQRFIGEPKPGSPHLNRVLAMVLVLIPLVLLPGVRDSWWPGAPASTENTPVAATRWLSSHTDLPGPLWSEIGFSSYLEFAMPERPTWIDTRFEVFPVEQWQAYKDITNATYQWSELLDDTNANLLMVSVQAQPKLLAALAGTSTWCEQYRDDVAIIFLRCGDQE